MKFIGDGVMALFESIQNEEGDSHAHRAVRAGLAMQLAALEFREWVKQHHPSQSLPEFSIGWAYTAAKCCCVTSARRAAESSR